MSVLYCIDMNQNPSTGFLHTVVDIRYFSVIKRLSRGQKVATLPLEYLAVG